MHHMATSTVATQAATPATCIDIDDDRVVEATIKFQNKDSLLLSLRFWI